MNFHPLQIPKCIFLSSGEKIEDNYELIQEVSTDLPKNSDQTNKNPWATFVYLMF